VTDIAGTADAATAFPLTGSICQVDYGMRLNGKLTVVQPSAG
jgi:hypothetical protein